MNLTHLRHLLAVADTGSFRSAASRLNISQSAVTKSLKALEAEFGVPLILRGSQGSGLTELGRELLSHARSVCTELERATERIKKLAGEARSRIAIGSLATASIQLLPDTVRHFQSRHPQVDIVVVSGLASFLVPRLLEGSLDVVIGSELDGPVSAGVRFEHLLTANYCVIVRRGHPLGGAKVLSELAEAEWIVPTESAKHDSPLAAAYRKQGLAGPSIRLQSDCPFFFTKMIATSDCVGLFRRYIMNQNVIPLSASTLEIPDLNTSHKIGVFTRLQQTNPVLTDEFVDVLRHHATRLFGPARQAAATGLGRRGSGMAGATAQS